MPTAVRVVSHRLLPGFAAGLAEPTAILDIEVIGGGINRDADRRVRAGITEWRPGVPFFHVADADWPHALLAPPGESGEAPVEIVRLGEWIIAVTIALQRWCHDPVWKGRVLEAGPQRVRIAVPWRRENVLTLAAAVALKLIPLLAQPAPPQSGVDELRALFTSGLTGLQSTGLDTMTLRFVQAAMERNLPVRIQTGPVQIGWGAEALRMTGSFTGDTGLIATRLAQNKFQTNQTLAAAGLPVPTCTMVTEFTQALQAANQIGWPVVVKPASRDRSEGVTVGVENAKQLKRAFDVATATGDQVVIVERQIPGSSHRLLVLRGRLAAATRRDPAHIVGDGRRSVSQLIELTNTDRGGTGLTALTLDEDSLAELSRQDLTPESVPTAGHVVTLRRLPNFFNGGTHEDVLSTVHADNREAALRAARIVGLDVAGIDLLATDITRSWRETGGVICEVNANPSGIPHWVADPEHDINGEVLDVLLDGRTGRVPAAAILGDDAAADTADLLHHIWTSAGVRAGTATAHGVRVGEQLVTDRDGAGVTGAAMVVMDPFTEGMVIQLPAARLQKQGHPCDRYDVVAVPGPFDAALAAEAFERAATVVLDADDGWPLPDADAILISRDPQGPAVVEHRRAGGRAVLGGGDGNGICLVHGEQTTAVFDHDDAVGVLAAVATAWALGVTPETIGEALKARS